MPTYDYRCKACGHEFEAFQMMSEGALRKCPSCKKLKLERLIGGGAGFVFKGSGYYVTDYRSKGYEEAKKADAPKDSASDGSSGAGKSKSDSKGASKAGAPKKSSGSKSDG